jgi:hypothetical protein
VQRRPAIDDEAGPKSGDAVVAEVSVGLFTQGTN